jgi:hypothetical protein
MIIIKPTLKDIGKYHATLSLKSLVVGDVQQTYLDIVVKDPNPP